MRGFVECFFCCVVCLLGLVVMMFFIWLFVIFLRGVVFMLGGCLGRLKGVNIDGVCLLGLVVAMIMLWFLCLWVFLLCVGSVDSVCGKVVEKSVGGVVD